VRFTTTEIARVVRGTTRGGEATVDGVSIDSREIHRGQLFVPIVAERDGHEFIAAAIDAGAAAYLTEPGYPVVDAPAVVVDVPEKALTDLGRHARTRLPDRVIGITGSVGKTTVKDLTTAALSTRFVAHASPRSFNNELGVPITLANAPGDVDAVVVEMGARSLGHIELLCSIARPTIGVVTTVALAHTEMFGTVEDVAIAKGELIEALPSSGVAVLNGDHPLVAGMASRTQARVVAFGIEQPGLDVTATDIDLDDDLRASFHLHSPWGDADVKLAARGAHQVMNALAAASAAMAAGVDADDAARGLAQAELSAWRMDLQRTASGALVLNDAYNANPTSMEAALRALAALPVRRRMAVVGVMAELGPSGPAEHRRLAGLARDLGVELIAVQADDYGVRSVADLDEALDALGELREGDAVLVKGSRVAGLERLADALLS
jgi:UDP-N-acetylmuramoyl-tripeptide--D-alanyl-D-alanine ligase